MPSGICKGCGKITNSAVSNWWSEKPEGIGVPTKCWAAFVDGKWERGCGYPGESVFDKAAADRVIEECS